jgi:hypothetical protein
MAPLWHSGRERDRVSMSSRLDPPAPKSRSHGPGGMPGSVFISAPPSFPSWTSPVRPRSPAPPPVFPHLSRTFPVSTSRATGPWMGSCGGIVALLWRLRVGKGLARERDWRRSWPRPPVGRGVIYRPRHSHFRGFGATRCGAWRYHPRLAGRGISVPLPFAVLLLTPLTARSLAPVRHAPSPTSRAASPGGERGRRSRRIPIGSYRRAECRLERSAGAARRSVNEQAPVRSKLPPAQER